MRVKAFFLVLVFGILSLSASGQQDPAQKLKDLDAQIEKTPDDPMLFYQKAGCLMKLGKLEEGYQTAQAAMALFIKKKNNLSWMLLESIDLENVRVDVLFNMGPKERTPPEIGIIRPLSFRVWSKDKHANPLEIIDFEIGFLHGKPSTAALGQTTRKGHGNFGIIDTKARYKNIREQAVELIKKRHPQSPNKPDAGDGK